MTRSAHRHTRPVAWWGATLALLGMLAAPAAPQEADDPAAAEKPAPVLDQSLLTRAERDLDAGRAAMAAERFKRLAESPAANRAVFLGLGRAELLAGNYAEAIDALVAAANFRRVDYDVTLTLANALRLQGTRMNRQGDYESAGMALIDAERFFQEAARLRPTAADPVLGESRVAKELGDSERALQLAVKATTVQPDHAEAFVELGCQRYGTYWYLKGMQGEEAARDAKELCRAAYAKALELDPKSGPALNGMGWIAMQGSDESEAIDWFKKSLLADPTLADSYANLARLFSGSLEQKKSYTRLLDGVVAAAKSFGNGDARRFARAFSHYQRGLAHLAARDVPALTRDFREAAKLDDSFEAAATFQIAWGLYRDNQYDKASKEILKQAEDDFPLLLGVMTSQERPRDAALMVRSLGDKCFKKGDADAARELFRITAEALFDSASDWNNYAFLCRETGKYEESYAAYQQALEVDEGNPSLLNDAALILHYHLHRDLDLAAEMYERAIEEGARVLEDEESDSYAKDSAKVALRDAKNNLRRLKAGVLDETPQRPGGRRPGREGRDKEGEPPDDAPDDAPGESSGSF